VNRHWDAILSDLTEAVKPRCLVEIGVAEGLLTAKLLAYCAKADAILHAIDPLPDLDVGKWRERYGSRLEFHQARSLQVLEQIHGVDIVFIDGDHNWFTVYHELKALEGTAARDDRVPPLIALHDVGWPYARRDMYYDPESIPEEYRNPYRTLGVVPGRRDVVDGGLNAGLNNAVAEGSARNGVQTAIDDFISESELEWRALYVPGWHGLGIVVTNDRIAENERLRDTIESYRTAEFLMKRADVLELERVRNEIVVHEQAAALIEQGKKLEGIRRELLAVGDSLANERRLTAALEDRAAGDERTIAKLQSELTNYQSMVQSSVTWQLFQRARRVAYGLLGGRESPLGRLLQKALRGIGRLIG
jgi:Methyltransferase domain